MRYSCIVNVEFAIIKGLHIAAAADGRKRKFNKIVIRRGVKSQTGVIDWQLYESS